MHNRRMPLEFTTSYLKDSATLLRYYKMLGEKAMAQVSDSNLLTTLDAESNSIAIIVKHLAGNMVSRWTDFLTTDGEKPGRDRTPNSLTRPPPAPSSWPCGMPPGKSFLTRSRR
jgi:hypothetical protein